MRGRPPNITQEQTGGLYRGSALARLALFENLVSAVPRRTSCRLLLSVDSLGAPNSTFKARVLLLPLSHPLLVFHRSCDAIKAGK